MDFLDAFDRQGRLADDLLMAAYALPPSAFTQPGPEGSPSLREIFAEWIETQRRAVHESLQDRPYRPLAPPQTATVTELARCYGGFRLTLREVVEDAIDMPGGLDRRVRWNGAETACRDVLAALVACGDRTLESAAAALRRARGAPAE